MNTQRAAGIGSALILGASLLSVFAPPLSRSAFGAWITLTIGYFAVAIVALLLSPLFRIAVMQLSKGMRGSIRR